MTDDLEPFYAEFGESVTVNAIAVTGLFDFVMGDAFGLAPNVRATLRVPATVAATVGQSVVRNSVTYTICGVDYADFSGAEKVLQLK